MSSDSLVLVDGWNHYLAAKRCYGYDLARRFPLDRLATHLVAEADLGHVGQVIVVMALPDRSRPDEEREFHTWRKRLRGLANYGVSHDKVRFSYLDASCPECGAPLSREVSCTGCDTTSSVGNRRKEKGADVQIAVRAVDATWNAEYASLILLSQDSDFGPLIRKLKEIHQRQDRYYRLYSAFPVCSQSGHEHREVPGTRALHLTADVYAKIASQEPVAKEVGQCGKQP